MAKYVTLIPLRGGSKGIPRKNIKIVNGKPLFYYVVKASLSVGLKTVVSTEDKEIKQKSLELFNTLEVIDRPEVYALDNSSTEEVIEHYLTLDNTVENIILLQATSPLTTSEDIRKSIELFEKNNLKPLISVVKCHSFIWSKYGIPQNYDPKNRPRRQDWDGYYVENGAIYIFTREHFEKYKCRCSNRSTLYEMKSNSIFEIDDLDDLEVISNILKKRDIF